MTEVRRAGYGGTRVATEESQLGFLASMRGIFLPRTLHRVLDIWPGTNKARAEIAEGSGALRSLSLFVPLHDEKHSTGFQVWP